MITNELNDLLFRVVIMVVSVVITSYVIPYFKSKIDSIKDADLYNFIQKVVTSANQLYTPEQWRTKKLYAVRLVEDYAKSHGVNIKEDEINALIEGFVNECKGGK